jgi:hypothetical protein
MARREQQARVAFNSPKSRSLISWRRIASMLDDRERTLTKTGISGAAKPARFKFGRWLTILGSVALVLAVAAGPGAAQELTDLHLKAERVIGPYRIEIREGSIWHSAFEQDIKDILTIRRDGKVIFRQGQGENESRWVNYDFAARQNGLGDQKFGRFSAGDRSPLANTRRMLVIRKTENPVHCCGAALIFALEPKFRYLGVVFNAFWFQYRQRGGQPVKADLLALDTLDMPGPIPGYAYCEVNLALRGGAFRVDRKLQRLPPYSDRLLEAQATELRKPEHWEPFDGFVFPTENEDLFYAMMTLVYSGNADQARRLLELTWPPGKPGEKKAAKEFWAKLRQSRYWPEISTLGKIKADGPERHADPTPICYGAGGN